MLFSDVEQSTLLLMRLGRKYEQALDACRLAQRAAWAACDGVEMGTEGDSFFVVFSTAEDAVRAAVEAQRALAAREWPNGEQVRVRMGIHTGTPRIHDNGYVGIDVHRAARIAASAHGGQVVVSETTAKLLAGRLPAGVGLRDLGGHRLKDLSAPEHLYQLLIPGARADFPPLKSVGTISSLPVTTTPLVGRRSEVAELVDLLLDREVRLVTLTGTGGSGKTRLAIAASREAVAGFPDGVHFVPLAAITTAEVIWSSIGEVLGLPATARTPPACFGHMAGLHALLVLDNLEQMKGADTAVDTLLHAAPNVVLLATSRRPLHLTSEHQYAVSPLALPTGDTLAAANASPAVRLFVDRARAVRASFALTTNNASEVVTICRHLDGLPLAIELAAARSKVLGPRALLARLDHALDLHGADVDRPSRQQALRDTIDWSYRLLQPDQQTLFRRLGVFAGGADLEALTAVCRDVAVSGDPVDLAADLVDASLATVAEDADGDPRFAMLETVRAFALEALARAGELEEVRRLHAIHFVSIAARLDIRLVLTTGEQLLRGTHLFDVEQSNFREVLAWATTYGPAGAEPATGSRRALGLALLSRIAWMWIHTDLAESCHWLEALLEKVEGQENADLGRCLCYYATVLAMQGDAARARESARRSVAVHRALDGSGLSEALTLLGVLETQLGDKRAGRQALEEGVDCARQSGDSSELGRALQTLAGLDMDEENWEQALHLLQEALRLHESIGEDYRTGHAHHYIAFVLRKLGRAQEAHAMMSAHLWQWIHLESDLILAFFAEDYSAVLADAGFPRFAPFLLGASETERKRRGTPRDQGQATQIADASAAARQAMTPAEWDAAHERGQRTPVKDALAEAISSTTDLRV